MSNAIKKQTASNNATLARIKAQMNAPTYKAVARTWNAKGSDAARLMLGQEFNDACRERVLGELFGEAV